MEIENTITLNVLIIFWISLLVGYHKKHNIEMNDLTKWSIWGLIISLAIVDLLPLIRLVTSFL